MSDSVMLKGGVWMSVEGYRKMIGYAGVGTIYDAIREGRLPGAKRIGDTWIIPKNAVIIQNNITHGGYRILRQIKEEYKRKKLEEEERLSYNKNMRTKR